MWGNRRKKVTINSLIGPGTEIRGNIIFSGGLHIDGRIEGNVFAAEDSSESVLTLSEQGSIKGEVRVPHVILNGVVIGNVYASGKAELEVNARINGNLYYNLIEMAMGAEVNGNLIRSTDMPPMLVEPPTDIPMINRENSKPVRPQPAQPVEKQANRVAAARVAKEPQPKE
ncbi:MAG: polymer-forming cytoskeletal protein [Thiotrichaceae bacterium]